MKATNKSTINERLARPDCPLLFVPTRETIESLTVGSRALDCFGRMSNVVKIAYRGTTRDGRAYVGFYTRLGDHSTISQSYVEGRLVRTVPLTGWFTSHELDQIEKQMGGR
jgi:hypothetical protein